MARQINLRLPEQLLVSAQRYADKKGFGNIQDFIKETIREKLFEEKAVSEKELALVKKLISAAKDKGLYKSEKELFRKLRSS